jgi:hypothetical protein
MNDESIYDMFRECLGRASSDETLKNLPVNSGCGRDCAATIRAANALIGFIERAYGDDRPILVEDVVRAAEETIMCFWHG